MKKNTYEDVKRYVEDRGCKLLSEEYESQEVKLLIVFSCGHSDYRSFCKFKAG